MPEVIQQIALGGELDRLQRDRRRHRRHKLAGSGKVGPDQLFFAVHALHIHKFIAPASGWASEGDDLSRMEHMEFLPFMDFEGNGLSSIARGFVIVQNLHLANPSVSIGERPFVGA
ncbi:hypothetical protein D3C76_1305660 [compost metagenome]